MSKRWRGTGKNMAWIQPTSAMAGCDARKMGMAIVAIPKRVWLIGYVYFISIILRLSEWPLEVRR